MAGSSKGFSENDRVNHQIYGLGTITSIDGSHSVIKFDEHGRKKFVTELLQIDRSDEPARVSKRQKVKSKK